MKHTNLITASFLALSLALASCASEEPLVNPDRDVLRSYEFTMFDSQDELNFSLIDINQPITRIESPFNWLDITQGENDEMGSTRINVIRTKPTPEGFDSDDAFLILPDNKAVKVTINAEGMLMPSDDNSDEYDAFNKEWWNQTSIKYITTQEVNKVPYQTAVEIPLPWAPATTSHIPASLTSSEAVSKNAGWTMAFNLFSASTHSSDKTYINSKPYFALYNKYTGTLRVFYYQYADPGEGGELAFSVTPDSPTSPKYPFYHSLQYAIPVSNTDILQKGNVLNIVKGNSIFQQMYTPYLASTESVILMKGWYCFDMDMSAYNPATNRAFDSNDRMTITPVTSRNSTITMAGTIEGKSNGTIENLINTATSSNKGQSFIDVAKSQFGNAKDVVASIKKQDFLGAAFKGAMTLYNVGKYIFSDHDNSGTGAAYEPPTLELSHNGKIDLTGYTLSNTSSSAVGVQFSYNAFMVNEQDHVGEGIWSLKDNPVIYVVSDKLVGDKPQLNVVVGEKGYLSGSQDPAEYNTRLMTFLDPRSLAVNINYNALKDIRNIHLSYTYGVYPNQPHGHTDVYRKDLFDFDKKGLLQEPVFIDKKNNLNKFYRSTSSTFANMAYICEPIESLESTRLTDDTPAPKIYSQKGAKYRYYGCPGNSLPADDKDFFIVDPVVLLPTDYVKNNSNDSYGEGIIYDFVAPDFVVGVMLTFDFTASDGSTRTASFSKRFIPKIRSICTDEAKHIGSDLEFCLTYPDIYNFWGAPWDWSADIKLSNADIMLSRTLKMLDYLMKISNNEDYE